MTKVRVSPHGGFLAEGAISSGTLRTQDLLRAFASEYERLLPFNSRQKVSGARHLAECLDKFGDADVDLAIHADESLRELTDELNHLAFPHGLFFGAHEGDGACFGFWKLENEDELAS